MADPTERHLAVGTLHQRVERVVRLAWRDLPAQHRLLLESVGADRWNVVDRPLAQSADELLRSAGCAPLSEINRLGLANALGVWVEELRLVLIDSGHPVLPKLETAAFEALIARTAWHEWGHALSVTRADSADISAGARYLGLAPDGVSERIRRAGYRRSDYTHEIVADVYALLMSRRRRGETGKPSWLEDDIYQLVRRISTWSE